VTVSALDANGKPTKKSARYTVEAKNREHAGDIVSKAIINVEDFFRLNRPNYVMQVKEVS
jgi:hypothetical protein